MEPKRYVAGALMAACLAAACGDQSGAQTDGQSIPAVAAGTPRLDADDRGLPAYLQCLQNQGVTLASAHRGGPAPGLPENAIATFAAVASTGPALLEVDVRITQDGVLVLHHDRELDDNTNCTGQIAQTTMRALKSCRLRDSRGRLTDDTPPTLSDALAWAKDRAILQLDVKERSLFPATVDVVRQADAFDRTIFITYNVNTALDVADLHPDAVISTTVRRTADLNRLERGGVAADRLVAWIGFGDEKPELVAELDRRGVIANFGTLGFGDSIDDQIEASGDDGRYRSIAATGVDIIATDRPRAVLAALAAGDDPADEIAICNAQP